MSKYEVTMTVTYSLEVEADSKEDAEAAFNLAHDTELNTITSEINVKDLSAGCKHLHKKLVTQNAPGVQYTYQRCTRCGKAKWIVGPEGALEGWV